MNYSPKKSVGEDRVTITLRPVGGGDSYFIKSFPLAKTGDSEIDSILNQEVEEKASSLLLEVVNLIKEGNDSKESILGLGFQEISYAENRLRRQAQSDISA